MNRGRRNDDKKNTLRKITKTKISLYNLRGEKIGELLPGGKIDFQVLLQGKKSIKYLKKRW